MSRKVLRCYGLTVSEAQEACVWDASAADWDDSQEPELLGQTEFTNVFGQKVAEGAFPGVIIRFIVFAETNA